MVLKINLLVFSRTNTPNYNVYGRGQKLRKPRKKILKSLLYQKKAKHIKERIIRDIHILFEIEVEERRKKKTKTK